MGVPPDLKPDEIIAMPISQTEVDDAIEMFSGLGPIRTRKMMGGLTIYAQDVTFAIYDPDTGYYLKSDEQTHDLFEEASVSKFTFEMKDGKTATMNYYALPEHCYDDPDELLIWARRSLDVALRAKPKKRKRQ